MKSDFIEPLLAWYAANRRDLPWRRTKDAYAVWVSEIMLQQTRVTAVIPYYERFLAALPTVADLANVEDERLHKLWEGLGYYSRANNLKKAARVVVEQYGGELPASYEALLNLPGVGPYTAGAVASIAYGIPVPAVDGNVLRVFARMDNDPSDITDPAVKQRARDLVLQFYSGTTSGTAQGDPGSFNAALMELGAVICVPNGPPRCGECPVSGFCAGHAAKTAEELPVHKAKKARRTEEKTVFALRGANGLYYGYQRPKTGLLAGLWQLPDVPGTLSDLEMAEQLDRWGARPTGDLMVYARRHIFTHVEWHMRVCAVEVALKTLPEGWRELDGDKALPTAYRICLP